MKLLIKTAALVALIYSTPSMALTKKECIDAGGTWEGTILTGKCTQKITAIAAPKVTILQITAEQCKKQGGTVVNGNCETVTHFKTGDKPKANQQQ